MSHAGTYLYCIARCSQERAFDDVPGIGDRRAWVRSMPCDGLAAIVSDASATEYECTRANMLAHQRVLERVMRDFPLLPVRFGTVASGPFPAQDISMLLQKRDQEFRQLLTEMDGKVELGLKPLWKDEARVFLEVLAENDEIRSRCNALHGKPPEATHFERIRVGEMVKKALDRKRSAEAASLLAPLRRIACRTVEHPVVLDRMIANAAFLVDKGREGEFDQAVRGLDEACGQRVAIKYAGPLPPYNFVNITVNWQEL